MLLLAHTLTAAPATSAASPTSWIATIVLWFGVILVGACCMLLSSDVLRAAVKRYLNMTEDAPAEVPLDTADPNPGLTYQQMLLLNPEGDPGLAAALVAHSQNIARRDRADYAPRHARRVTPEPLPTHADLTLLCMEIDLHMGFQLDVRADTVHVTPRQLRALEEFCALRYTEVRTPAQVFGLHGLAVEVSR